MFLRQFEKAGYWWGSCDARKKFCSCTTVGSFRPFLNREGSRNGKRDLNESSHPIVQVLEQFRNSIGSWLFPCFRQKSWFHSHCVVGFFNHQAPIISPLLSNPKENFAEVLTSSWQPLRIEHWDVHGWILRIVSEVFEVAESSLSSDCGRWSKGWRFLLLLWIPEAFCCRVVELTSLLYCADDLRGPWFAFWNQCFWFFLSAALLLCVSWEVERNFWNSRMFSWRSWF